jgi:hypothetical protein
MGKPSGPPPIDYQALARQQGAENKEVSLQDFLLNNSSQYGPDGSRRLIKDPNEPGGYRFETTLDPMDQKIRDQGRNVQSDLLGLAPGAIDTMRGIMSKGIDTSNLPGMVSSVNTGGMEKLNLQVPQGQYGFDRGDVQGNLDFSGLKGLESGNDVRNRVEQAGYDKWASRALPQQELEDKQLNTRIANMGGTNSPAAIRMRQEQEAHQADARQQAQYESILKGGEEASRQFGMGLQERQQGTGELAQQGAFRNAAQEQDYGQLAGLADLWNGQRLQDANLQNMQAGFNNNVTQADITNQFSNANLTNAAHAAGLNEISQLRQMPLNEIMAILGGTQVNSPQFQAATPTSTAPAPIFQAGQAQGQQALGAANAASAQRGQTMGMLGSIAGSFFGPIGTAVGGAVGSKLGQSDRRLKSNIVRVGITPGGIPVYDYDIHGQRTRGVMADEVPEDARVMGDDGYWMVDYSKVP